MWKNKEQCESFPLLKSHLRSQFDHLTLANPLAGNANAPHWFTSLEAEQFIDLSSDLTLKSIAGLLVQY